MNALDALKADTCRQFGRFGWGLLIKGALFRRTFRVLCTMRLCQWAAASRNVVVRRLLLPAFKFLHRTATHSAAMDFSWNADIGAGLALTHGWSLVVSQGAKLGTNCTLFHGVTLGCRDRISATGERVTEYPVLEDDVWVGPHAVVVGGVTVGRGSRVAGGAFVVESVPPYSIVAGNPAVIAKSNCLPDVMNRAPV